MKILFDSIILMNINSDNDMMYKPYSYDTKVSIDNSGNDAVIDFVSEDAFLFILLFVIILTFVVSFIIYKTKKINRKCEKQKEIERLECQERKKKKKSN
ncbi:hypothetical protein [Staphylococcus phage vB_StaM_SA1]|nr:hypothetical protein [Staphylococcus phage vB_StaM_SA1]